MADQEPVSHSPKRFAYIDALRGYALLAVILVHVYGGFPNLPEIIKTICVHGARGVQLFFALSAFTLMLSWQARGDHLIAFYIRRLFRIAPLFWLALVFYTCVQGMGPSYWAPNGMDWRFIAATLFFIHGWHLETINSVVPGGWSIAVEMNFYLLFPFIVRYITSTKRAFIAIVLATLLASYSNTGIQYFLNSFTLSVPDYMVSSYAMLWFFNQLPSFATGIFIYYLMQDYPKLPRKYAEALLAFSFLYLAYACIHQTDYYLYKVSFAFGGIIFSIAQGAGKIFVNRFAIFTGKVSYSGYLSQFFIINQLYNWLKLHQSVFIDNHPVQAFAATYFLTVAATLGVSYGLHYLIEKPMIIFGHRLAKRYQ